MVVRLTFRQGRNNLSAIRVQTAARSIAHRQGASFGPVYLGICGATAECVVWVTTAPAVSDRVRCYRRPERGLRDDPCQLWHKHLTTFVVYVLAPF